jgi:chemotaxis protein methyltransferase CheR
MIDAPVYSDVMRFRSLILDQMGLQFDDAKTNVLVKLLQGRAQALNLDYAQYLQQLAAQPSLEELGNLARELTVTETYFLRNFDQFRALLEVVLPERSNARGPSGRIEVLSAGCASGEEAYSLAIAVQEFQPMLANNLAITAVDINPNMLQRAAQARYSAWALRESPDKIKQRWFRRDGDAFVLNDTIRRAVSFEARNLNDEGNDFWRANRFDVVFCRNVLMYFSSTLMQAAIARIAKSLVPGGYLFLGHAETLRGISNDFHLCHTHNTFYYQRKDRIERNAAAPVISPESFGWRPTVQQGDTSWITAIQEASERIHGLASSANNAATDAKQLAVNAQRRNSQPLNLDRALESLRSEQYGQLLQHLHELDGEHATDPDVLLLKAISLSQSGALQQAEKVCRELLQQDDMHAGAHYVLALCREGAGDVEGALEHDQTAAYLDPDFAMPRFHLGLLQRRRGETTAARQDLSDAMILLQKEDASRVLLFGGGFKRETLIGLCRAELAALGEAR